MSEADRLLWEVLNATADDWESLEQLVPSVCRSLPGADAGSVAAAVTRLEAAGLLERRTPPGEPAGDGWFSMTPAGRAVWQTAADLYIPPRNG